MTLNIRSTTIDKGSKIVFAVLAHIGIIGAFGQAAMLYNSLVHSYPFKMMGVPPADFYSSVGKFGYYFAAAAAVVSILFTIRSPRFLTSVVPVMVCPLVYWIVFEASHLIWGFSREQMMERNFDGYTGNMARYEFGFEVLVLMFFGVIIGGITGIVIARFAAGKNDLPLL